MGSRALFATAGLAAVLCVGAGHTQGRPPENHYPQRQRVDPPRGFNAAPSAYGAPPGYGQPAPYGQGQAYGVMPMRAPPSRQPQSPPVYYGPDGQLYAPRTNSLGAEWRQQQEEARQGVRMGQMAPLGRVIDGIHRRTPGRELDAGIELLGARPVYRVRWVTAQGHRVDYIVDAATGEILSQR